MPWSNNASFNFHIFTITVTPILPKLVKIGPKLGPKCTFPFSLNYFCFVFFAKISFKTMQSFTMGHSLAFSTKKNFFLQGADPRGFRNHHQPKIACFSRLTALNSILIVMEVRLKLFFKKNCFGLNNGPENSPKLVQNVIFPYLSELFLFFLVSLWVIN